MSDYNDGKWHGWNGGECPVHPESVVECRGVSDAVWKTDRPRSEVFWPNVIVFRVIKPYVEPREGWIVPGQLYDSARQAKIMFPGIDPIHVREVKE